MPPIATIFVGPALSTAPARGPWGFRHHGTPRRQSPTSAHAVGPGTGKSGGGPSALATPPRSRSRAPSKPHRVRPASVNGTWSRHRLENPTAKALFTRPGAQPSARRRPAARGGSVITGPRGASRPPARRHTVGPGTGKSGGRPSALATHATLPLKSPQQAAWRSSRLSQGPMVASPPRKSHGESFVRQTQAQPSVRHPPAACGGSVIMGP